jgi:putative thioredoxin
MLDLGLGHTARAADKNTGKNICDTTTTRFENDVITLSLQKPVIVDFWAPWCGPCRQMMPSLEKAVNDENGAVALVKVNIDENPELAQAFRVQSVPMVYAFFQGQPVDGFMGAKPASELKAFIDKLKKLAGTTANDAEPGSADVTRLMQQADAFFKDGNYNDAIAHYSMVLDAAADNMDAMAGIGWCFVAEKQPEALCDLLGALDDKQKENPRVKGLLFMIEDRAKEEGADVLSALYNQAIDSIAMLDPEAAIDTLVELTRKNREWKEQKARHMLLALFEALGPHPLASSGRRKLSSVLFS